MNIKNMKQGQNFYYFSEITGLVNYTFIDYTPSKKIVNVIKNGEIGQIYFSVFSSTSLTAEEAIIKSYKSRLSKYQTDIEDLQDKIKEVNYHVNELKEKYQYLEKEFPEHFL